MHGEAEAAYIPAMATAPESIGFTRQETATTLCRAIGGMALVSALVTKAEWGAVPVVPFKAHLAVDMVTSLFTLAAPWLFNFSHHEKARNTFLALGATGLVVSALSRSEEMDPMKERSLRRKAEALPAL
jgi:hypothetical protein